MILRAFEPPARPGPVRSTFCYGALDSEGETPPLPRH